MSCFPIIQSSSTNFAEQEKAKDESIKLKKKIETLTGELGDAKKEADSLKKQLDLAAQSGSENSKLIKEVGSRLHQYKHLSCNELIIVFNSE